MRHSSQQRRSKKEQPKPKRHSTSALLGLLFAPVIWGLAAWSSYRIGNLTRSADELTKLEADTSLLIPLALLAVVGAFVGLILGTQLSPLGPGLCGLSLLGVAGYFLSQPATALKYLEVLPGNHHLVLMLPAANGFAFILGVALLVPLFVPGRWRGPTPATEPSPETQRTAPPRPKPRALIPAQRDHDALTSTTTGRHRALRDSDLPGDIGVGQPVGQPRREQQPARARRTATNAGVELNLRPETVHDATGRHHALAELEDLQPEPVGADVPRRRRARLTEPIPTMSGRGSGEPDFSWRID